MNTTEPTTPATGTATLDADRTDRLRTFLVVEAAADLAHGHVHSRGQSGATTRRLALGGLAVALLVGATIALDAGTTSKANRADAAVSITEEGGWTTLELNDPDADADEVLAELHAAGITAEAAPEGTDPSEAQPGTSTVAVGVSTEAGDSREAGAQVDPGTIVAIEVQYTEPQGDGSRFDGEPQGSDEPDSADAQRAEELAIGVRTDPEAHTVSIRDGEDHPVTLFVAT